jgi:hypothetical protein
MTNTRARQTYDRPSYWIGEEEVNGIIIGGNTNTYQFWHKVRRLSDNAVIDEPITSKQQFDNDDQAITWFRANYPTEYAAGAEMRVYE